jgi:hypothetical protein
MTVSQGDEKADNDAYGSGPQNGRDSRENSRGGARTPDQTTQNSHIITTESELVG